MKQISLYFVALFSIVFCHEGLCFENYYINGEPVLFYKIIDWWHDCIPEDSDLLCGSRIKYISKGETQVEYNEKEMSIKFKVNEGFADLLSMFKKCETCLNPSYFRCTWLNDNFFGLAEANDITSNVDTLNEITINAVSKDNGKLIKKIENKIDFELEGMICGLLNGKVSLHRRGDLIKSCPTKSNFNSDNSPITLRIMKSNSNEILAKYSMIIKE